MLLRWLLSVFPRELRRAWQRLVADAFVWCAIAGILTALPYLEILLAPGTEIDDGSVTPARVLSAALAFVRITAPPLVFVIAAARFSSPGARDRSWPAVGRLAARRTVPALTAWLAASALALIVSLIGQYAVIAVLAEMEGTKQALAPLSTACRIFIYVSLMARFAFVPFIAALERRAVAARKERKRGVPTRAVYRLAWPLVESWARTQALAWQLFPYVLLVIYAPMAVGFVWTAVRGPASFVLQLVSFTALAVLFNHYSVTSEDPGLGRPGAWQS
jgi:hypothetical protein